MVILRDGVVLFITGIKQNNCSWLESEANSTVPAKQRITSVLFIHIYNSTSPEISSQTWIQAFFHEQIAVVSEIDRKHWEMKVYVGDFVLLNATVDHVN